MHQALGAGQALPVDLAGNWDLQEWLRNGNVSLRDKPLPCLGPLETTATVTNLSCSGKHVVPGASPHGSTESWGTPQHSCSLLCHCQLLSPAQQHTRGTPCTCQTLECGWECQTGTSPTQSQELRGCANTPRAAHTGPVHTPDLCVRPGVLIKVGMELKGRCQEDGTRLFSVVPTTRMRGNKQQGLHRKFALN